MSLGDSSELQPGVNIATAEKVRLSLCALDNVLAADCLGDDAATFLSGWEKAGVWLSVPTHWSTYMRDPVFITAVQIRLGVPIIGAPRTCRCGAVGDVMGHHALMHCTTGLSRGAVTQRHTAVQDVLRSIQLESVGLITQGPKGAQVAHHFGRKKPAGPDRLGDLIALRPTIAGPEWPKIIDLTIVAPIASNSHVIPGASAAAAEERKFKHYMDQYHLPSSRNNIIPFAAEAGGFLGTHAVGWLQYLARTSGRESWEYSGKVRQYYERIAVVIQAMNVALIHKWLATGSSPLAGAGAGEAAACG